MSYDITLRSDDRFSRNVSRRELQRYLSGLAGLTSSGSDQFILDERAEGAYMEIDLERVSEGGDTISGGAEHVNCIRVHIPAAYANPIPEKVNALCREIARRLEWRVYDEQLGEYLGR